MVVFILFLNIHFEQSLTHYSSTVKSITVYLQKENAETIHKFTEILFEN